MRGPFGPGDGRPRRSCISRNAKTVTQPCRHGAGVPESPQVWGMRAAASPSPGAHLPCRARCAHAELPKQARSSSTGTMSLFQVPRCTHTCAHTPLRTLYTCGHKHLNTHTLCRHLLHELLPTRTHTVMIAVGLPRHTQNPTHAATPTPYTQSCTPLTTAAPRILQLPPVSQGWQ